MKMAFWQRFLVLTVLGFGISTFGIPARAAQFDQQEVDQSRFIILAAPGGDIGYKLLIIEQLNNKRLCWSETGSNPSSVDPLLLNFDFTGICGRIVDSNGFSVRTAGTDQALQYSLRILKKDNDLLLVAASNSERNLQIVIGHTYGLPNGFSRIVLNPDWRLTRRVFNGKAVGHVYLTSDQPIEVLVANARSDSGSYTSAPSATPSAPASPSDNPPANNLNGNSVAVPALPPGAPAAPPRNEQINAPSSSSPNQSYNPPSSAASSLTTLPPPPNSAARSQTTVNRPPLVNNPVSSASSSVSGSVSGRAPAETYQVIVLADSAETQDKVRTVAPNAILTTINGQVVMQVGVFRERQDADRLQQRLSMQGLPTSVIPVR
jgi:N-acetylmuramoyl-L-alanine amidase